MLQSWGRKFAEYVGDHWTRRQVERGIVPKGKTTEEVVASLKRTLPKNRFEMWGFLEATVRRASGKVEPLGLVSVQKVTTAFAAYVVDSFQNSTTKPLDVFKYHASGTGTSAEANTETALVTEVEDRVTGNLGEGSSANIFKTIGTVTYTDTRAIREHGVFSADEAGTLLDRSLLGTAVNVENNDQIEWTYQLTVNAES